MRILRTFGKALLFLVKVILLPVVGILSVLILFFRFVLAMSGAILGIASGLAFFIGAVLFIAPVTTRWNGVIVIFIAFLISPLGLPLLVEWLIERFDDLNWNLKQFVFG